MKVLDEDFEHSIRFIQSAVIRLADIINALLKLSRAGRIEYQVESVAVDQVIARIVESMHSEAERRGVTIQVQSLPPVEGDQLAIEQVFANLLDNALKYSNPNRPGKIVVGVLDDELATNMRTFFVRDNGLGLPEQGRDKVFKAFERFHGNIAPGEGMGLAIVKRIVNRHGGEIRLESSPGEGCVFYVSLPLAPLSDPVEISFREPTSVSH